MRARFIENYLGTMLCCQRPLLQLKGACLVRLSERHSCQRLPVPPIALLALGIFVESAVLGGAGCKAGIA